MALVVTSPCRGCKDKSCLSVCPAECFHEDEEMVYIDPDECIDCHACEAECPVDAIYAEDAVPSQWKAFIELNAQRSGECPSAH